MQAQTAGVMDVVKEDVSENVQKVVYLDVKYNSKLKDLSNDQ